jgi:hypothetical protein
MVLTTIRTPKQVAQAATGLIADTATERSLGFFADKDVGFEVRALRYIPRNGIAPHGERQ